MQKRSLRTVARLAVLALGLAVVLITTTAAPAVTPAGAPLPSATQVTIHDGAGNQTDPHVSGDLATYTEVALDASSSHIRYYNFATGAANGIANDARGDFLSDVSGTRIVFTRVTFGSEKIMLLDLATGGSPAELDPSASSQRHGGAIGGNTVAWTDLTAGTSGELVVHDLVSSATQQLTSNTLIDRHVAVSPDGNALVWEQCTSTSSCDIAQAVRSGATWTVGTTSATPDNETLPDTNGSIAVYAGSRGSSLGGADIYWKSVAGGTEQQLAFDGTQRNPSVSGNLIAFESYASGQTNADEFVYDVSTNLLYQLTNTPTLSESLNDISVTGSAVRVVWAAFEGSDENVYGLTFQLPPAIVTATAEFNPATLNLQAKGKWVNVLLEFALGRSPADVDVSSVTLQAIAPVMSGTIGVAPTSPVEIGDADRDGTADLTVRFDRAIVQSWFSSDAQATLRVEGSFRSGTAFAGNASVRVINAGAAHTDEGNAASVKP